jgi:hypothetical protein
MKGHGSWTVDLGVAVLLAVATFGCNHVCLNAQKLQPTSGTNMITERNVEIRAATLPGGTPAPLEVKDYCPTDDVAQKLVVGWSETDAGTAEYASITFPSQHFGAGPESVEVVLCHYKDCSLTAYDAGGTQIASVEHTAGQNVNQTLTLTGGAIRRIDIVGAEIGITSVCWAD